MSVLATKGRSSLGARDVVGAGVDVYVGYGWGHLIERLSQKSD